MRLLLVLTALIRFSLAVFSDEAYQIDYHHALLGIPEGHNTFFHQPNSRSKASLIYTLSEKSLIGAVNPKDGAVLWRQQLPSAVNSSNALLRPAEDQDVVFSATDSQVAAWTGSDGKLIWAQDFEENGQTIDLQVLDLTSGDDLKDVLVLGQGSHPYVQRRDGSTGDIKWQFGDMSGDIPHQIAVSGSTIYLVSLHSSMLGGMKIKVTEIDAVSGKKTEQHLLSSDSEVTSSDDVVFVGSSTPIVAWTDKANSILKINILGTKSLSVFAVDKKGEKKLENINVHAPSRPNSLPHFLVEYQSSDSNWAEVYHINVEKSTIAKAYDLPKLAGKGAFATSTSDANVYFTRIAKGALVVVSSVSHGVIERYMLRNFVPGLHGNPDPLHAVSEVLPRAGARPAVRAAVLLSSGDWALILNGETAWSRPEALTLASTAVFADLPQGERLARELAIEEHSSIPKAFTHRVQRHINDLEKLPDWLKQQPARIMASFTGKDRVGGIATKADKFGFHKLVVVATENGRLIAIDTASGGEVAWNAQVPDYLESAEWEVPSLRASAHGIIRVKNPGGHWVFDTMTGNLLRKGTDSSTKSKAQTGTVVKYDLVDGQLKGYIADRKESPMWSFTPKEGERILNLSPRPVDDPVASIGIVLGDRRVLYKYLNPNLVLVITVSDKSSIAFVYLLDSVSGNILYEASHSGVDTTRTIASIVSENWLSYTFTTKSGAISPSRGHHLVMAALFESSLPDDRGTLGSSANYSSLQPSSGSAGSPYVLSQSYQISEEVSQLAVSQTQQGITSRLLIATVPESDSIVGIPLPLIDPRRPVGRDPTANEQAEGLTRYTPVLEFSPQWYLNHKREVIGVKKVITSPAILESTSLVFAYGLDVFGTRVNPSFSFDVLGKEFNKLQMLGTVAALFVGVLFVAPLVRRKQINTRWQIT